MWYSVLPTCSRWHQEFYCQWYGLSWGRREWTSRGRSRRVFKSSSRHRSARKKCWRMPCTSSGRVHIVQRDPIRRILSIHNSLKAHRVLKYFEHPTPFPSTLGQIDKTYTWSHLLACIFGTQALERRSQRDYGKFRMRNYLTHINKNLE